MAKAVVTIEVKGFEHWHPGSKGHAGVRPRIGDESRTKAYRTAEDPNDISIIPYDVDMEVLPKMMSDSGLNCPDWSTWFNLVWRLSRHLDLGVHRIFLIFYLIQVAIGRMRVEIGTPPHDLNFGMPYTPT